MPDCKALLLCLSVTGTIINLFSGTFPLRLTFMLRADSEMTFSRAPIFEKARELCTTVRLKENLTVEMFVY